MLNLRRVIRISAPFGALVALASALPAQGAPPPANCSVTGTARTSPPMKVDGGSGTYSFDNSLVGSTQFDFNCLLVAPSSQTDWETLSVTSTGAYGNTSCGTGTMDGTNTGITATSLGFPGTSDLTSTWSGRDLSYHIVFTDGVGVMTFTTAGGGGVVSINPSNPQSNGVDCADTFTLVGDVTIGGPPIPPPPPVDPVKTVEDAVPDGVPPPPPGDLLAAEAGPPPGYPSSKCYEQGGAGTAIADPSELGGAVRAGVYRWNVSGTQTDLCVRVHGGGVASAGGLLEVDTRGAPGGTPQPEVADSDTAPTSCPNNLHHTNSPVLTDVSYGTNPPSVCVTVGTTVKRVTLKSSGGSTVPQVCWTPDPAGTRSCTP